jgi:hypothetical protein
MPARRARRCAAETPISEGMSRVIRPLALLVVLATLSGCGYHLGPYQRAGSLNCCRPSGKE